MSKPKKSGSAIFMYIVIAVCVIIAAACFTLHYGEIFSHPVILWTGVTAFTVTYHLWVRLIFGNITDVFPIGSECEDLYLVRRDGRLVTLHGDTIHPVLCEWMQTPTKSLEGTFQTAYALTFDRVLLSLSDIRPVFNASITSFAVGDDCYAPPFVLALGESR